MIQFKTGDDDMKNKRILTSIILVILCVFALGGCGGSSSGQSMSCTFSINCADILDNMDKLDPAKTDIIPSDGVIYGEKTVEFTEGETVLDLIVRETRENKIHMEYESVPFAFVEGIANIYNADCGTLSGWTYTVNGVSPSYGCNEYILQDGDKVEWIFSCDVTKGYE